MDLEQEMLAYSMKDSLDSLDEKMSRMFNIHLNKYKR